MQTPVTGLPVQPRAIGHARVAVRSSERGTVLQRLYQKGALKVVFPRTANHMQAVLVNTAGGITGGDAMDVGIDVTDGAALTVTTQASERAYKAQPGETGRVRTRLSVGAGGLLQWVPQELILFDGCAIERDLEVSLDEGASALIVEPMIFGRSAMGENVVNGRVSERIRITRAGAPLVTDAWALEGDLTAEMDRPGVGAGARAMASLTFVAPDAEAHLGAVRGHLPEGCGASLLAQDVLVVRMLTSSGFMLRQTLLPVLDQLTGQTLPTCWRL